MSIIRSESYEGPALDWLFAQVGRLRRALDEAGVTDQALQRTICESFFFGLAAELDDVEVGTEPRPRRRLAFEDSKGLLLPEDETFDFHDYVLGVVGEAFGDT